ncbi:MAG TPA: trehalase family glycosidase, partial [Bacteroidota bacterium]|nr:trehalase family glycosidase [Bacteroidota bacterium]
NRLIWTPPFPLWLDYPGFWDKAHYYNYEIEPVFTWTVLDEKGREISLRAVERKWGPSKLVSRFEVIGDRLQVRGLGFEETKCCLPNDVLTSVVRIRNTFNNKRKLHFIAWTVQPSYPSKKTTWLEDVKCQHGMISFLKQLNRPNSDHLPISCSFGINRNVKSYSVNLSEGSVLQPHWKFAPFVEKFLKGRLPNEVKLNGVSGDGLVYIALHTEVELKAKSEEHVAVFFTASPKQAESSSNINFVRKQNDPLRLSEQNWNDFFSSVPYFECSDEFLTRYYWYRWYGLKLNTINVHEGNYNHPFVCEGIDYFRAPISYSAPCHMHENRWIHDPMLAQGSLLAFIDNQRNDGGFRGYLDPHYYRQEMFYHANWGKALRELHAIHPDVDFLSRVYNGLVKYVAYFDRERDKEVSGMYDITNHYETGQEYSSRYLAVSPNADKDNWGEVFRMKGVDVTVYLYELKRTLAWMAGIMKDERAEGHWSGGAEEIKRAVLERMWDHDEKMFFDVDPTEGKRTKVKAVTCFYPYMTDIVSKEHLPGLKKHLFNPKEFWTPYPVPSSSVDDEYFSAEAEWKGKRMNCPWNGRVWPMTNSHIAEAIAQTSIRFNDEELRARAVEFITKFIRMMFFSGDSKRPNCFEHYNPLTGQPSLYRGVDDYMHSWVADLIIKYVGGIRPEDDLVVIDPLPFNLSYLILENVFIRGHLMNVRLKKDRVTVWVDGRKYEDTQIGKPIIIRF